ncbi:MAG: hypothetical protein DRP10_04440 [Candidatus Aenigmatarchaeota archaeon]|nr:MAG: hypothetical protein DRP10_04440 [Candidatus Aenigmarchaeota archaeon]
MTQIIFRVVFRQRKKRRINLLFIYYFQNIIMTELKVETSLQGEIKKLRDEIAEIKKYLNKLVELDLAQIKEENPTPDEVKLLRKRANFKKEEYLDWNKVENGI